MPEQATHKVEAFFNGRDDIPSVTETFPGEEEANAAARRLQRQLGRRFQVRVTPIEPRERIPKR